MTHGVCFGCDLKEASLIAVRVTNGYRCDWFHGARREIDDGDLIH